MTIAASILPARMRPQASRLFFDRSAQTPDLRHFPAQGIPCRIPMEDFIEDFPTFVYNNDSNRF